MKNQSLRWAHLFRRNAARYGTPATLRKPSTGAYNPATGAFAEPTAENLPEQFPVKGFFDKQARQKLNGVQLGESVADVTSRAKLFLIPEAPVTPYTLLVGWTVELAGRIFHVAKIEPHQVQDAVVYYRLELQGA